MLNTTTVQFRLPCTTNVMPQTRRKQSSRLKAGRDGQVSTLSARRESRFQLVCLVVYLICELLTNQDSLYQQPLPLGVRSRWPIHPAYPSRRMISPHQPITSRNVILTIYPFLGTDTRQWRSLFRPGKAEQYSRRLSHYCRQFRIEPEDCWPRDSVIYQRRSHHRFHALYQLWW